MFVCPEKPQGIDSKYKEEWEGLKEMCKEEKNI